MKFRHKQDEIEAVRWEGDIESEDEVKKFTGGLAYSFCDVNDADPDELIIPTLEGDIKANVGDWIIKGLNGEFYPLKTDIFEKTYEPIGQED